MRKLLAGFAMSMDGFIEGPNGEYDWIIMDSEQYSELAEHWKRIDTLFYGRKTYNALQAIKPATKSKKKKLNDPFAHMKHYVFSNTLESVVEGYELVKGDLVTQVTKFKSASGKEIAVFGGAELVSSLLNCNLIDELQLVMIPVVLGKGKPFFNNINGRKFFELKQVKTYASGLVSITYLKKN